MYLLGFLSELRAGTGSLDEILQQLASDGVHETKLRMSRLLKDAICKIFFCRHFFEKTHLDPEGRRMICQLACTDNLETLASKLDSDQKDTVNTGFFNSLISIGQKIVGTVLSRKTSEERINIIDESRNVAQSKLVKDLFSERRKILEDWPELNDIVNAALEATNKDYADHIAQRLKSWQKKVLYEVKKDTKNYTDRLLKGLSESKKSESLDKFFKDIEGLISNSIAK